MVIKHIIVPLWKLGRFRRRARCRGGCKRGIDRLLPRAPKSRPTRPAIVLPSRQHGAVPCLRQHSCHPCWQLALTYGALSSVAGLESSVHASMDGWMDGWIHYGLRLTPRRLDHNAHARWVEGFTFSMRRFFSEFIENEIRTEFRRNSSKTDRVATLNSKK